MASKPRIKDIAALAGVSPGTVDRVLHGRGKVSEASRIAVEKVLNEVNYTPNLYLSSISMRKRFRLAVAIPECVAGEYWEQVRAGILRAVREYDSIDITCDFFHYNQFDLFSCRSTFERVAEGEWDAVIIGPTFKDETIVLANHLNDTRTPYVYVDSMVDGTSPMCFFSADQQVCGYLIAKLIHQITPEGSDYVLCQAKRVGDESANNTLMRKIGFMEFFRERGLENNIRRLIFSAARPEDNEELVGDFFERNPDIKGGAILSSRGGVMADYLKRHGRSDIRLVTLDLTRSNIEGLRDGGIGFVICQRPAQQGFSAVKALMMNLVFGQTMKRDNYMPLDIVTEENLPYYNDLTELTE
ncbi:MAG: substrate-binding domain-containing protein [Alistipes sp.]|nr:substrate-binding domain-containing protein [Alistipes sp.]